MSTHAPSTVSVCGLRIPEPDFTQAVYEIELEIDGWLRAVPTPFRTYLRDLSGAREQASAVYHHLIAGYLSSPPDRHAN